MSGARFLSARVLSWPRNAWLVLALAGVGAGPGCAASLTNYQLGMEALDAEDDELAETHFAAALDDPDDANRAREQLDEIWLARARAYENMNPDKAADEYRRLLVRDPAAFHARMRLSALLERKGDIDAAIYTLAEAPDCRQCAAQASSLRTTRGLKRLSAKDYAGAAEDLAASVAAVPEPRALLALVQCFTAGGIGTAADSVTHLNAAYPMIAGHADLQTKWAAVRADLVRAAAKAKRWQAGADALAGEDPRVQVDAAVRAHDTWALTLELAAAQQKAGAIDEGLSAGKTAWSQMRNGGHPIDPKLREAVVGLYLTKISSLTQAGQTNAAVELVKEATQAHPEHHELRLVSALIVAEVDVTKGRALLDMIQPVDAPWRRARSLIDVIDARKLLAAGELGRARKLIDSAQTGAPGLLEARLAYAQWLALSSYTSLGRKDKKALAAEALVDYGGNPMRWGQALAELLWVKGRYAEPGQQAQVLRMPGFRGWLAKLETELRGDLAYETRKLPGDEPRLIVKNTRPSPLTVEVDGPGLEEAREIMPGKQETFVFDEPGLVRVEIPEGRRAVLAEHKTGVIYAP